MASVSSALKCCFHYWDTVGYVARPVHGADGLRATSVSEGPANKTLFASQYKSRTNVINSTDSATKGN